MVFALLSLERAGAINQCTTGLEKGSGFDQKRVLESCQLDDLLGLAEMGNVGVTPDNSRRGAGCIEEHGIKAFGGLKVQRIGDYRLGRQPQTAKVFFEPL